MIGTSCNLDFKEHIAIFIKLRFKKMVLPGPRTTENVMQLVSFLYIVRG